MDDGSQQKGTQIGKQEVKEETELRNVTDNVFDVEIQYRELADKGTQQANSEEKSEMAFSAEGDRLARQETGQEAEYDGHQKLILKVT